MPKSGFDELEAVGDLISLSARLYFARMDGVNQAPIQREWDRHVERLIEAGLALDEKRRPKPRAITQTVASTSENPTLLHGENV